MVGVERIDREMRLDFRVDVERSRAGAAADWKG
jgi:hypothetical protein